MIEQVALLLRLPVNMMERVEEQRKRLGLSKTGIVKMAIIKFLEEEESEIRKRH